MKKKNEIINLLYVFRLLIFYCSYMYNKVANLSQLTLPSITSGCEIQPVVHGVSVTARCDTCTPVEGLIQRPYFGDFSPFIMFA